MIPAGFVAARGEFLPPDPATGLAVVVIAGVMGSLVGAFVNYGLSLKLGRPFLYRYGRYFFLSASALERAEEVFRRHGEITTFVLPTHTGRSPVDLHPGRSGAHAVRQFALFTGLGAGIWVVILALAGYMPWGRRTREMSYAGTGSRRRSPHRKQPPVDLHGPRLDHGRLRLGAPAGSCTAARIDCAAALPLVSFASGRVGVGP